MVFLICNLNISSAFANLNDYSLTNTKEFQVNRTLSINKNDFNQLNILNLEGVFANNNNHLYGDVYQSSLNDTSYSNLFQLSSKNLDSKGNIVYYLNYVNNNNEKVNNNIAYNFSFSTRSSYIKYNIDASKVTTNNVFTNEVQQYLKSSPFIESDNELIIKKSNEIVGNEANPYLKAKKIYDFVYMYMDYDIHKGNNSALEALDTKVGVCEDYARLMVALLRAQEIPARTVGGLAFDFKENTTVDAASSSHMWVEFYLNNYGWIPADPTIVFSGEKEIVDITFAQLNRYYIPLYIDIQNYLKYSYDGVVKVNITVTQKVDVTKQNEERNNKIVLKLNSKIAQVYNQSIYLDAAPYLKNNRTMVPLRFISENLNTNILWDNKQQKITIQDKETNRIIELIIGNEVAYIDGVKYQMGTSASMVNNRTMVPLRFISEALNGKVEWKPTSQEIIIN